MPLLPKTSVLTTIQKCGLGGLNTFDFPDDIDDIELSDIRNMVFDDGFLQPRKGSQLLIAKPTGETANPSQMLIATNSVGLDYLIAIYGTNFYLYDNINNQWIKINQAYSPTAKGIFYGSANWNAGLGTDVLYFGNGTDDTMKWGMGLSTLQTTTAATDTTLTLSSTYAFPTSGAGTIIVMNAGTPVVLAYSSISGHTITLSGTVGHIIPAGSSVTLRIVDMSAMPKGKLFTVLSHSLMIANYVGSENTIYYSLPDTPETFVDGAGNGFAGYEYIFHGKGGIISLDNFGEYMLVIKEDILLKWVFVITIDSSNVAHQTVSLTPVINGDGIGAVDTATTLNYMNTLYYPTSKQGIISFSPDTTGTQTTSGLTVLSQKINPLVVDTLDFTKGRTCGLAQKLYWATSLPLVGIPLTTNNLVLMYDLIRASENPTGSAWTVFDNWNAADIKPVNDILYYLSMTDGAIYQCYVSYQDAIAAEPLAYTTYALTKRFNLNSPATLMRAQYLYLEGYITLNTKFYVKVLNNENGYLGTQSYEIAGNNPAITFPSGTLTGGLGRFVLASPMLGGLDLATLQAFQAPIFFRVYLELSQAFRQHNVQAQMYSVDLGSQWGVSKMVLISQPEDSIETRLVMSPATVPLLVEQSLNPN